MDGEFSTGPSLVSARHDRRLSDKVLAAFHAACDANEFDIARQLIEILEGIFNKQAVFDGSAGERRSLDGLVDAHQRLWLMRNRMNYS